MPLPSVLFFPKRCRGRGPSPPLSWPHSPHPLPIGGRPPLPFSRTKTISLVDVPPNLELGSLVLFLPLSSWAVLFGSHRFPPPWTGIWATSRGGNPRPFLFPPLGPGTSFVRCFFRGPLCGEPATASSQKTNLVSPSVCAAETCLLPLPPFFATGSFSGGRPPELKFPAAPPPFKMA